MYYVHTINDTLGIPPAYFGNDIKKVATEILRTKYERTMDKDLGIILVVFDVKDISDGFILPGDPSTHHDVTFNVLSFKIKVDEVMVGEVSETLDFGGFIRIGPMDGLVHLSQITSDFVSFDRKTNTFTSRNTGKSLKKGDKVYAKVSTISMKGSTKDAKIALTMRPEGLGKSEWILAKPSKRDSGAKGKRTSKARKK